MDEFFEKDLKAIIDSNIYIGTYSS